MLHQVRKSLAQCIHLCCIRSYGEKAPTVPLSRSYYFFALPARFFMRRAVFFWRRTGCALLAPREFQCCLPKSPNHSASPNSQNHNLPRWNCWPPPSKYKKHQRLLLVAKLPNSAPKEATRARSGERVERPVAAAMGNSTGRHEGRPPLKQHLHQRLHRQRECPSSSTPVEFISWLFASIQFMAFARSVRFRAGDFANGFSPVICVAILHVALDFSRVYTLGFLPGGTKTARRGGNCEPLLFGGLRDVFWPGKTNYLHSNKHGME